MERGSCCSLPWLLHPNFASQEYQQPHRSPVENGVAVSLGAVPQAMAVAPYEVAGERRRRLGVARQQRRKVQAFGAHLHLREKPLAEADPEADPILAVDTAQGPRLPSEHLVDLPTGHLELEGTYRHSLRHQATHSHQFAMLLRLARIGHILHSHLYPREWALYVSKEEMDGQAEKRGSITQRATHLNHLPHHPLQGPVPVALLSPSLVAAYGWGGPLASFPAAAGCPAKEEARGIKVKLEIENLIKRCQQERERPRYLLVMRGKPKPNQVESSAQLASVLFEFELFCCAHERESIYPYMVIPDNRSPTLDPDPTKTLLPPPPSACTFLSH